MVAAVTPCTEREPPTGLQYIPPITRWYFNWMSRRKCTRAANGNTEGSDEGTLAME